MSDRPNVVLLMADQWRGDCLGIEGHPVVDTPALDALALSGARFGRAYTATPTCVPARAALMTGLTQEHHGFVGFDMVTPWPYRTTMASAFTGAGYQTQAIGKMHWMPERSLMGFENVILHSPRGILRHAMRRGDHPDDVDDYGPWLRAQLGREASAQDHGLDSNSNVARPWDKPEHVHPTNFVATKTVEFLAERNDNRPLFLFVSFNAPHPPYDPPAWAFEQYIKAPMPDPPIGDWLHKRESERQDHLHNASVAAVSPQRLRRARAGYYGHITHVDHQINRVIEALRDHGLADNTWFCFLSDHGEMLGDHHHFRKSVGYEGSARVPMILAGPRGCGVKRGSRVSDVVELRDVMPTLLDCAGIDVPEGVDGRSFLPQARGKACGEWRTHLHGEHTLPGNTSMHWIVTGDAKYVWFSRDGVEQLFDLVSDPQECHDLAEAPDRQPQVEHLRGLLIDELRGREEGFVDGDRLIAGRPLRVTLSHLGKQV